MIFGLCSRPCGALDCEANTHTLGSCTRTQSEPQPEQEEEPVPAQEPLEKAISVPLPGPAGELFNVDEGEGKGEEQPEAGNRDTS